MKTLLLSVLFSISLIRVSAQTLFVKADATGSGDGTSWANACGDLPSALTAATAGDTILVAKGTYKPAGTVRTASFARQEGVNLFGGWAGDETTFTSVDLDARDFVTNETILSRDINTPNDLTDNAYHVINFEASVSSFTSAVVRYQ